MGKINIYTSIYGGRDKLSRPKDEFLDGCDFASFTGDGGLLDAKRHKVLPHRYFQDYEISVWIDGNVELLDNIRPIIRKFLRKGNMAVLRHPAESLEGVTPYMYREAEVCLLQGVGNPKDIKRQVDAYRKEGCPADREAVMLSVIIRRHNEPSVIEFDKEWWRQINKYSYRDQISFPYVAWKQDFKYSKLNNVGFDADWYKYNMHLRERVI